MKGGEVKTVALLMIFSVSVQASWHLPVTIEVTQAVEVTQAYAQEARGKLRLGNVKAQAFWLRKGQRFQMVEIGQEGSCWIAFEGKKYGLTSCPWLDGFSDHQADVFRIVTKE